jgi:hypothetical protein
MKENTVPIGFRDLQGDYRNPAAVSRWIEDNVPCTKGPLAEAWTSALFDEARRRHISESTISLALAIVRIDGYNFAGIVWSALGPVYVPTRSRALADAAMALDSTALIFGEKFIRDSRVRANYLNQAREASREIQAYVYSGEMSAEEGALKIQELRNALLDAGRLQSSDLGRAVAVLEKATGKTLEELKAKYAGKLFNTEFATLNAAQRDAVFLEIVRAGGRPDPKYVKLAARVGKAGKAVLIVSFAFAAYNVATSDRPGREAVKQSVSIGAGIAGGAGVGLACGPGAPICVGVGALVGGIVVALGAEQLFDWLWE